MRCEPSISIKIYLKICLGGLGLCGRTVKFALISWSVNFLFKIKVLNYFIVVNISGKNSSRSSDVDLNSSKKTPSRIVL